jgi:ATP-binding cassette subfamily B protein
VIAIPVVVLPIVWFWRRLRRESRSSQDRIADIGAMVTEVLGAARIVQAFNQETRENDRFAAAVERSFGTALRRISAPDQRGDAAGDRLAGAADVARARRVWRRADFGRHHRAIRADRRAGGGRFRVLTEVYGDLVRGAGAASRCPNCSTNAPPSRRARPRCPARRAADAALTSAIPAGPKWPRSALSHLKVEPGETVAIVALRGGQIHDLPAGRTFLRSRRAARSSWTACR